MEVWRIVKEKYADKAFSGEGASLYGGRWNHPGTEAIYVSQSLSLAALELFVNLEQIPEFNLLAIPATIPKELSILKIEVLPGDWNLYPAPQSTKDLGNQWLKKQSSLLLKVPSVVIPSEFNFIINPNHEDFVKITIGQAVPFNFDHRLFNKEQKF